MGASEPTATEVGHALEQLGNYRVRRAQELVHLAKSPVAASEVLGLGLRENGLKNRSGGAIYVGGKWIASYTDRGWTQISDQFPENAAWLKSVPGCPDGSWDPAPGHNAYEPRFNPRFTDATNYTLTMMRRNYNQAAGDGVKDADRVRFVIAAHNAGYAGALRGYREGNVDAHTTLGDYSKWVLKYASIIHQWVVNHPGWVYSQTA